MSTSLPAGALLAAVICAGAAAGSLTLSAVLPQQLQEHESAAIKAAHAQELRLTETRAALDLQAQGIVAQRRAQIKAQEIRLAQAAADFNRSEQNLQSALQQSMEGLDFLTADSEKALTAFNSVYLRLLTLKQDAGAYLIAQDHQGQLFGSAEILALLPPAAMATDRNLDDLLGRAAGAEEKAAGSNSCFTAVLSGKAYTVSRLMSANVQAALLTPQPDALTAQRWQELLGAALPPDLALSCTDEAEHAAAEADGAELKHAPCSLKLTAAASPTGAAAPAEAALLQRWLPLGLMGAALLAGIVFMQLCARTVSSLRQKLNDLQQRSRTEEQALDTLSLDHKGLLTLSSTSEKDAAEILKPLLSRLTVLNHSLTQVQQAAAASALAQTGRTLQLTFLPAQAQLPVSDFLAIAALLTPCFTRQSALYDVQRIDEDNAAFFILRAEHSSLKAMCACARAALRLQLELKLKEHAGNALQAVNDWLRAAAGGENSPEPILALCGIINEKTGNYVMAGAGGIPALTLTPQSAHLAQGPESAPLGQETGSYTQFKGTLVPGDALVLATPEVWQMVTPAGATLGQEILHSRAQLASLSAEELLRALLQQEQSCQEAAQYDSAVMVLKQLRMHF